MRPRCGRAAAVLVLLAGVSGCGSAPPKSPPSGVDELEIPTPSPDPADFVTTVDNPWFPLAPGSRWSYRGRSEDGVEKNTVTVLDRSREVDGVAVTVVHDVVRDRNGGLLEDTYDWYAQDRRGNVWYFGEDTTAYEHGRKNTEGSWEAGVDGAQAGVIMLARPRIGDGYRQEYLPDVAEDAARVAAIGESVTVPAGEYDDVVMTEDTTPLEPDLREHKYYAKGVGLVREQDVAGGADVNALVSVELPGQGS